jgi:hypothetical protein
MLAREFFCHNCRKYHGIRWEAKASAKIAQLGIAGKYLVMAVVAPSVPRHAPNGLVVRAVPQADQRAILSIAPFTPNTKHWIVADGRKLVADCKPVQLHAVGGQSKKFIGNVADERSGVLVLVIGVDQQVALTAAKEKREEFV